MIKKVGLPATFLFSLTTLTVFASTTIANNMDDQSTIHLSLVNASGKIVCIQDEKTNQCSNNSNQELMVRPQYFYERNGVIRVSIGNQPLKIAMIKKDIQSINLYVDNSGKMQVPEGTFEKGSFVYSDNRDYLYFVAKPNALFTAYPV
jgi:hypothetical protein